MRVCIFEDQQYRYFLPLTYLRPVYDLRCGVRTLREKLIDILPRSTTLLHARAGLAEILKEEYRGVSVNDIPNDDLWFVNGRLVAGKRENKLFVSSKGTSKAFVCKGQLVAAFVRREDLGGFTSDWGTGLISPVNASKIPNEEVEATLVNYPWELVHSTAEGIENDFERMREKGSLKRLGMKASEGAHLLNRKNIVAGRRTTIRAGAVLDATNGPIVLGEDVTVMSNAVIEGPAYIGDHSIIKIGAKIYHGTSIGPRCKVGGEVEASIIQAYSNKQHDGFLGHSYLGSWVNIGADTNNSDLKNNYGTVKVVLNGETIDTKSQFVGLIMGDHSKTGINTMFNTGTVVGVSCNIYGAGFPPKYISSFSWGERDKFSDYSIEKALETAVKVMARRDVRCTPAYEKAFKAVYNMTEHERRAAGIR